MLCLGLWCTYWVLWPSGCQPCLWSVDEWAVFWAALWESFSDSQFSLQNLCDLSLAWNKAPLPVWGAAGPSWHRHRHRHGDRACEEGRCGPESPRLTSVLLLAFHLHVDREYPSCPATVLHYLLSHLLDQLCSHWLQNSIGNAPLALRVVVGTEEHGLGYFICGGHGNSSIPKLGHTKSKGLECPTQLFKELTPLTVGEWSWIQSCIL